ncbi:hypothetical protein ElyMa_002790500 [Elysia marginata]|uniref:Uncharacterized protein n=1 Tax=Elysia marginata TaxID=1093978 RepID=A0AAV4HMC6_9GAST|nr:hypothetical protein ElyMa_002790500 [Elysia marginata]
MNKKRKIQVRGREQSEAEEKMRHLYPPKQTGEERQTRSRYFLNDKIQNLSSKIPLSMDGDPAVHKKPTFNCLLVNQKPDVKALQIKEEPLASEKKHGSCSFLKDINCKHAKQSVLHEHADTCLLLKPAVAQLFQEGNSREQGSLPGDGSISIKRPDGSEAVFPQHSQVKNELCVAADGSDSIRTDQREIDVKVKTEEETCIAMLQAHVEVDKSTLYTDLKQETEFCAATDDGDLMKTDQRERDLKVKREDETCIAMLQAHIETCISTFYTDLKQETEYCVAADDSDLMKTDQRERDLKVKTEDTCIARLQAHVEAYKSTFYTELEQEAENTEDVEVNDIKPQVLVGLSDFQDCHQRPQEQSVETDGEFMNTAEMENLQKTSHSTQRQLSCDQGGRKSFSSDLSAGNQGNVYCEHSCASGLGIMTERAGVVKTLRLYQDFVATVVIFCFYREWEWKDIFTSPIPLQRCSQGLGPNDNVRAATQRLAGIP